MIKFFRSIRFKLMRQNQTSRYIKYAIGEIILVVIGILIALSINNWNEDRKARQQEIKLVSQLLEDAKNDSIFYQSRLRLFNGQISTYQLLLNQCDGRLESNDSITLRNETSPFMLAADQSIVMSNKNDYNDISDEAIKRRLRDYALSYTYITKAIAFHSDLISEELGYLAKSHDLVFDNEGTSLAELSNMCEIPNIQGILRLCLGSSRNAQEQAERFIADNAALIDSCNDFFND